MSVPKLRHHYCKSAIFTCSCCAYFTTIYTTVEWVEEEEGEIEEVSPGEWVIQGFIYRDDLDKNDPIHPQFTHTPLKQSGVTSKDDLKLKIHWTEQPVRCMSCKTDTMHFTEYNVGVNMELLHKRWCVEALKPRYELITWIDENGNGIMIGKGSYSKFSAS